MLDTAPAPVPAPVRRRLVLVVLLAGVGGGVLTEWLQGVLAGPWAAWANSVATWCLVAFAVGALSARARAAVLAGIAVELLLVGSYYVAQLAQELPVVPVTVAGWLLAGVVGGTVFGTAGRWWRAGQPPWALAGAALTSGVVVAEGLYRAVRFPWQGSAGVLMVAVGVALALLLGRSWRQRAVVLGALALVVPLGWLGTVVVDAVFTAW